MGKAVKTSITIGLDNPDCGMDMMMDLECKKMLLTEDQLTQKPCCENKHQVAQLSENAKIQSSTINANPVFTVAFVHAFMHPLVIADHKLVDYTDYAPPIPDKSVQVLLQTFLI